MIGCVTVRVHCRADDVQEGTHRIICLKPDWLVGSKICQVYPVPGGDQHILALDVTMAHPPLMTLSQGMQQLKGNPMLQAPSCVVS